MRISAVVMKVDPLSHLPRNNKRPTGSASRTASSSYLSRRWSGLVSWLSLWTLQPHPLPQRYRPAGGAYVAVPPHWGVRRGGGAAPQAVGGSRDDFQHQSENKFHESPKHTRSRRPAAGSYHEPDRGSTGSGGKLDGVPGPRPRGAVGSCQQQVGEQESDQTSDQRAQYGEPADHHVIGTQRRGSQGAGREPRQSEWPIEQPGPSPPPRHGVKQERGEGWIERTPDRRRAGSGGRPACQWTWRASGRPGRARASARRRSAWRQMASTTRRISGAVFCTPTLQRRLPRR